jgi:hypothetical protein
MKNPKFIMYGLNCPLNCKGTSQCRYNKQKAHKNSTNNGLPFKEQFCKIVSSFLTNGDRPRPEYELLLVWEFFSD